MIGWVGRVLRRRWKMVLLGLALVGYWLAPISGHVVVTPGQTPPTLAWPQIQFEASPSTADRTVTVTVVDVVPWGHVLLTVDGQPAEWGGSWANLGGTWTWKWTFAPSDTDTRWPPSRPTTIAFFHDCHTGCEERGRVTLGGTPPVTAASAESDERLPTKLGVVFANPERDWHGRAGWDVELTYARLPDEPGWGVDDLAVRVQSAMARGLRVLVRVDYDRGQSLPPTDDYAALTEYLRHLRRLARDDRLRGVYGYVVGSGFNALDSNTLAPERPVTPGWYARLFNGYGAPASRTDNVVQTVRAEHAQVRVLVGPVRPWVSDQDGERPYQIDVPWLNYTNSLVAAIDEGARAKAASGIALAAPDGFALQAPGRPVAAERLGRGGAEEPLVDLPVAAWGGAQGGFRVYQEWLDIINRYPTTCGLPTYITSTNTFAPDDGTPPAQNYPPGWLTNALQTIDAEPQVLALCWFLDGPLGDDQWQWFSLSRRSGRLLDAAEEFDRLL